MRPLILVLWLAACGGESTPPPAVADGGACGPMPGSCDNGSAPCSLSLEQVMALCAARPPGSGAFGWECCSCAEGATGWSVVANDCPPVPSLDAGVR